MRESCCHDDYEYNNVPIFYEYPSEELEGDCIFEIEDGFEDLLITYESPNKTSDATLKMFPFMMSIQMRF